MSSIRRRGQVRSPRCTASRPGCGSGRNRWFNLLWLLPIGFVGLIVAVAAAKGLRNVPSVERFIVRYPGHHRDDRCEGESRAADLGRRPALLQPVPADLHHPLRAADPQRPSSAVLDAAQHSGQGLVPRSEAGARRSVVDREAGLDQPAGTGRSARNPALHRSGPLVAPRGRLALAAQRPRVLRPVVRHRPVASCRAHQLGGVPQRRCRS